MGLAPLGGCTRGGRVLRWPWMVPLFAFGGEIDAAAHASCGSSIGKGLLPDVDENKTPSTSNGTCRPIRIVVADDVPEVIEAIRQSLPSTSEIVSSVGDGSALVQRVLELQPDLVITDISMPQMTGLEALRQLRRSGFHGPVIVITIHEDEELATTAIANGCSAFVLKSHLARDLGFAMEEALAGRKFISSHFH